MEQDPVIIAEPVRVDLPSRSADPAWPRLTNTIAGRSLTPVTSTLLRDTLVQLLAKRVAETLINPEHPGEQP